MDNDNTAPQAPKAPGVTEPAEPVTLDTQAQTGTAGEGTPEDTVQVYKDLVQQQKDEISALLENQKSMQSQINALIRNGASINEAGGNGDSVPAASGAGDGDNQEDYVSLADLGKEIGSRNHV